MKGNPRILIQFFPFPCLHGQSQAPKWEFPSVIYQVFHLKCEAQERDKGKWNIPWERLGCAKLLGLAAAPCAWTFSFSQFLSLPVPVPLKPGVWRAGALSITCSNVNNYFLQKLTGSGLSNMNWETSPGIKAICCFSTLSSDCSVTHRLPEGKLHLTVVMMQPFLFVDVQIFNPQIPPKQESWGRGCGSV